MPFTTKGDLRDHYPFGLAAVPMKEVIRVHASSGTTSNPTVVAYTRHDVQLWSELMARTYAAAGVTDEDLVHNAYGYGLFTGGLGFHYGAERLGATVIPVSGGNTKSSSAIRSAPFVGDARYSSASSPSHRASVHASTMASAISRRPWRLGPGWSIAVRGATAVHGAQPVREEACSPGRRAGTPPICSAQGSRRCWPMRSRPSCGPSGPRPLT